MRKALRFILAVAAVGLTLAPTALASDTAVTDLVLARDACGSTDELPPAPRLDLSTGASTLGCGSLLAITGGRPTSYPAVAAALPVELDATREIYAAISISSYLGVLVGGVGPETVELTLTGKRGEKVETLGTATSTTPAEQMLTKAAYLAEFTFPANPELSGTYTSLTLDLTVGGSQFSGFVDHDGRSLVSLPVTDASVADDPVVE